MSSFGIFAQCFGRGIPEDRNECSFILMQCISKWKKRKPSLIFSTDEELRLFRFVKETVQEFLNGRGKTYKNCAALVDMHIFS